MTESTAPAQAPEFEGEPKTTDHLAHLPGVDPEWARQFIEYDQKFLHFYEATGFFWVTPRVVKIGILKPTAIIGLLKRQHKEYSEQKGKDEPFEESISMDWEAWTKPVSTSLPIWDLEQGLKCYLQGMTPIEALQDIHADSEDGHENDSIGGGTVLLEPIMVLMGFAIFIVGIITSYTSAHDARSHAAEVELRKSTEVSLQNRVN